MHRREAALPVRGVAVVKSLILVGDLERGLGNSGVCGDRDEDSDDKTEFLSFSPSLLFYITGLCSRVSLHSCDAFSLHVNASPQDTLS